MHESRPAEREGNVVALVQARMSSRRLPGKVLEPLAGRPLVWHTVTRMRAAGVCDRVVVVTSTEPADDAVARFCKAEAIDVFRGSLDDVLDRFYRAAREYGAEHIVRVTADCPMLDPAVSARVVRALDPARFDYATNTRQRSFPIGLDTEALTFAALERCWNEARLPSEREHVTPFVWKHPERFRIAHVAQAPDRSAERWTVDEPADLEFARAVFDGLGCLEFGQQEVLELLERRPALRRINGGIEPHEGYRRSLDNDPADGPA